MEGHYRYGYPRRSFSFNPNPYQFLDPYHEIYHSNPNDNYNPDQFLNPYHHPNPNGNYYSNNPYYDSVLQPNQYRDPYQNSISQPNQYRNHYQNPNPAPQPPQNPTPKPKIISIPVQYVKSDTGARKVPIHPSAPVVAQRPAASVVATWPLPEMAAVRIQKVVRGFLVRKNWSIVRKIEAEAEAIGEEIARDEMVLEKEVKARIRFGEMLMNLLFRLDSVRGVRDYRKKVIRKVISLQELVDSISTRGNKAKSDTTEVERSDLATDFASESAEQNSDTVPTEENKMAEPEHSMEESPIDVTDSIKLKKCTEQTPSSSVEDYVMVEAVKFPNEPIKLIETAEKEKLGEKQNVDEEFTEEAQELDEVCDPTETIELEATVQRSNPVDDQAPGSSSQAVTRSNENYETEMKGMRDVMERVVVESERMKHLMEELCQSSARQWSLMEGLVDRVQRLEKEVAKMEKKGAKKRKGNGKKSDSFCKKCDDL